jgi:hypothetical protein
MNWKLIFQLSLFGLAMAISTVFWIPSNLEPFFWLVIFIICAYLIATHCTEKYFLHGLFVSLANSIWITAAHVLLFKSYIANHPKEAEMMTTMFLPTHPRLQMLITGPIVGLISGLVLGLFAFIASKVWKGKVSHS